MSEPRALFVTGEYPPRPGGIADYTHQLRLALAGIGAASRVLTSGQPSQGAVLTVERWGWGALRRVRELARDGGTDVVDSQYQAGAFAMHPEVNLMPWWLARAGVPVVVTFHDLRPPFLFPKAGVFR